jgi:hypothetical protein
LSLAQHSWWSSQAQDPLAALPMFPLPHSPSQPGWLWSPPKTLFLVTTHREACRKHKCKYNRECKVDTLILTTQGNKQSCQEPQNCPVPSTPPHLLSCRDAAPASLLPD